MLQRFVAGSLVCSVLVACAALIVIVVPALGPQKAYPLTAVWCFMPAVWGLWAAVTPHSWFPKRLPIWGAILGFIVGGFVFVFINPAHLILGLDVSRLVRGISVLMLATFYYLLWMLVRLVAHNLAHSAEHPHAV